MKINQLGIDLIKNYEGLRLAPYRCSSGIPTIGVGATFYKDGKPVAMTDPPITEKQVDELLQFHIKVFEKHVITAVKVPLTSNQFSALVSLVFNIGATAFNSSTLSRKLNNHDYGGAAEQFLAWNKSKGKVMEGLIRRRKAERELFLKADTLSSSGNLLPDGPSEQDIKDIFSEIDKITLK